MHFDSPSQVPNSFGFAVEVEDEDVQILSTKQKAVRNLDFIACSKISWLLDRTIGVVTGPRAFRVHTRYEYQEKHFDQSSRSLTITDKHCRRRPRRSGRLEAPRSRSQTDRSRNPGEKYMAGQVILYFDDQADALRFALAAGSVMAGENANASGDLVMETTRVCRIRLDAVNAGKIKKVSPPERAA